MGGERGYKAARPHASFRPGVLVKVFFRKHAELLGNQD